VSKVQYPVSLPANVFTYKDLYLVLMQSFTW